MKPQASNSTAAAMMPTFLWSYIINAGKVQGQGEVSSTDPYDALLQTLTSSHLDQETYSGVLGVRPEELGYALNPDPNAVEHVLDVPNGTLTLKKQTATAWERLNLMVGDLRQAHRLKQNVDFAFTLKGGQLNVLCPAVYEDLLRAACTKHSFYIGSMHTYP